MPALSELTSLNTTPTPATAWSPICRLSKDTEISAAVPKDYKAAYFLRLPDS